MNHYLAGVGRALLLYKNNLIGVGKTYTQSTFSFSATPEEVRAGEGNALQGRFFHDSNLAVSIVDAMFKLEYVALKLGVDIEQGGLSVYESGSAGETTAVGGTITATELPVALDGAVMAWYKKPGAEDWSMTTQVVGKTITIPGARTSENYCIKYFYQNPSARMLTIPAQFNPSELHVILIHDLYSAGSNGNVDMANGSKVGRLITDIPRLQLDPNLELNLTPTSAATVDFGGTALAVNTGTSCEEDSYYGTMTEEIFGADWKDNVIAVAIENGEVTLDGGSGDKETLIPRVVYNNMPAQRKLPTDFTFTILDSGSTHVSVDSDTGVVTALGSNGVATISVALKGGAKNLEPAYARVTVSGNG